MRKKLGIFGTFLFLTSFHCHAFFTGALWLTKAPVAAHRDAGALDVYFYFDDTMDIDFYRPGGEYVKTITGSFRENLAGDFIFEIEDSDGWIYSGTYDSRRDFLTGRVRSPARSYCGRFQATWFAESADNSKRSTKDSSAKRRPDRTLSK